MTNWDKVLEKAEKYRNYCQERKIPYDGEVSYILDAALEFREELIYRIEQVSIVHNEKCALERKVRELEQVEKVYAKNRALQERLILADVEISSLQKTILDDQHMYVMCNPSLCKGIKND